ncbi:MAG: hypothetical protein HQ522_17530 [Bacteroidetes bacterium]|nr:hypothetical protein [Bacteroidota bacterium]
MKTFKIKISILFIILFISPVITKPQSDVVLSEKYKKGIILLKDRKSFNGENLVFSAGQLTFISVSTSQPKTIPLEDIKYVKAQTGSYAFEAGLVGAGLSALGILSAYSSAENDPTIEVKESRIPIILGVGIIGGAVIGSIFKKEKIVFKDNKFTTGLFIRSEKNNIIGDHITSIGLKIQFQKNKYIVPNQ